MYYILYYVINKTIIYIDVFNLCRINIRDNHINMLYNIFNYEYVLFKYLL